MPVSVGLVTVFGSRLAAADNEHLQDADFLLGAATGGYLKQSIYKEHFFTFHAVKANWYVIRFIY